jgi:hypothetical protein
MLTSVRFSSCVAKNFFPAKVHKATLHSMFFFLKFPGAGSTFLARATFATWANRMILNGFVDDSGSGGGTDRGNIFILAGFIANPERWKTFSNKWMRLCNREPKTPDFHITAGHSPPEQGWFGAVDRDREGCADQGTGRPHQNASAIPR